MLFLGITLGLIAQSVPQGMNYQAVARDMDGRVLADQNISLKISLLGDSPDGKVMYSEIHEVETSGLGLFNVVIGEGAAGLECRDQQDPGLRSRRDQDRESG